MEFTSLWFGFAITLLLASAPAHADHPDAAVMRRPACPGYYAQVGPRPAAFAGFLQAEIAPLRLAPEDAGRTARLEKFLLAQRRLPNPGVPAERSLYQDIDSGLKSGAPFLNSLNAEASATLREATLYRRLRGRFQRDLREYLAKGRADTTPGLRVRYDFWRRLGERFDEEGHVIAERRGRGPKPRPTVTLALSEADHARAAALNDFVRAHGKLPNKQNPELQRSLARALDPALPFLVALSDQALRLLKATPAYARARAVFTKDLEFYRRVKPGAPLRPDQERKRLVWDALDERTTGEPTAPGAPARAGEPAPALAP